MLVTSKNQRNESKELEEITKVKDLLWKPLIITSFDVFPSVHNPGKEAIRIIGFAVDGNDFVPVNAVTEGVDVVRTLKNVEPGDTLETMVIRDNTHGGRLGLGRVTKEQQEDLKERLHEKRNPKQSEPGDTDNKGNLSGGTVQGPGEGIRGTSGTLEN